MSRLFMRVTAQPSRNLLLVNWLIHTVALFSILNSALYGPQFGSFLVVLVLVSLLRQFRSRDSWELRCSESGWSVNLEPDSLRPSMFVGHWFMVLRFSLAGYVVIGRDSLPASDYRRLAVLLRGRSNRMMVV